MMTVNGLSNYVIFAPESIPHFFIVSVFPDTDLTLLPSHDCRSTGRARYASLSLYRSIPFFWVWLWRLITGGVSNEMRGVCFDFAADIHQLRPLRSLPGQKKSASQELLPRLAHFGLRVGYTVTERFRESAR